MKKLILPTKNQPMVVMIDDDPRFSFKLEQLFVQNAIAFEAWPNYQDLKERLQKSKPGIMLLDMRVGDDPEAGLKALKIIKTQYPSVKAIVLTGHPEHITKAFKLGADGYLLKDEIVLSLDYLKAVIKDVKSSQFPISEDVKRTLIQSLLPFDKTKADLLNDREKSIILLSASDKNVPQIGEILKLSSKTVETYLRNIKSKLDCHTIQGLVGKAFYYRIINSEDLELV